MVFGDSVSYCGPGLYIGKGDTFGITGTGGLDGGLGMRLKES